MSMSLSKLQKIPMDANVRFQCLLNVKISKGSMSNVKILKPPNQISKFGLSGPYI